MKVLLAAAEVAPIIKLGGLGDVIGSLPKALEELGIDADVIVPFYPIAKTQNINIYKNFEIYVPFNGKEYPVDVYKTKLPGSDVDVLLLKNDDVFGKGGKKAFANSLSETEMFAFFNRSVVEYVKSRFNTYDLIHCHDWHTGMIVHLLEEEIGSTRPATVFTIHNLSYQGKGGPQILLDLGIVPGTHPLIDWDLSDGDLNFLQQGISSADYINAVSESYAQEVLTEKFGGELSEILETRKNRIRGILNGIDYTQFPRGFDINNYKEKKLNKKKELIKKLKADFDIEKPLFSFISRLDPNQKGLDILIDSIPYIAKNDGQFILLGTGDPIWESKFEKLTKKKRVKNAVSINIEFDVDLALDIYAGSDFFLVPSKFEPCGLTQMISMWYGTIPIVHNVGGLKDSVAHRKNGFVFKSYSTKSLDKALSYAFKSYEKPLKMDELIRNAFETNFSWHKSAKKYKEMYQNAIDTRHHDIKVQQEVKNG